MRSRVRGGPAALRFDVRTVVGLLATLAPIGACGPPDEAPRGSGSVVADGTRQMVRRLAEQVASLDPSLNEFLNSRRAALLRQELAGSGTGPEGSARTQVELGLELLRAGEWSESVRVIGDAIEMLDSLGESVPPGVSRQVHVIRAVARLRRALDQTCVASPFPRGCVLPLAPAEEKVRSAFEEALEDYRRLVAGDQRDASARWLLNLSAMGAGAYPEGVPAPFRLPEAAFRSEADIGRFEDVAPTLGLDLIGLAGGSVLEDLDGDGDLDLMVSSKGLLDQLRYFRNDGDGTFTERTQAAGLDGLTGGLNLKQADYDNDGDRDVLVLRGGWSPVGWPNSLLRNEGDGTFADVTEQVGLLYNHPTQTAAWGDYDNDGDLDLYVGNETHSGLQDGPHPSRLHRNNGDGAFTDVAPEAGVRVEGFVKGVAWGDYDNDERLDLYVSRIGERNLLFHNRGPDAEGVWRFEELAEEAGVTEPGVSFSVWFFDYDNDGWQDLYVSSWRVRISDVVAEYLRQPHSAEPPRLYRNKGDGTFTDVTTEVRLDRVLMTMGSNYGDLDNDGYPDLFLGTGNPDMRMLIPTRVFRNDGGERFREVTASGGFGHIGKGHSVSFGDVDGDGDQDVYVVYGAAYEGDLFRNALHENPGHGHHWLTLRLAGVESNRAGIGARIRVTVETEAGSREIHVTAGSGGSFGGSSLQQEIGLGAATGIRRLEVLWPGSGTRDVYEGIEMDRIYLIREGSDRLLPVSADSVGAR